MDCGSDNYYCKLLLALFSEPLEIYVNFYKSEALMDKLLSKDNIVRETIIISTTEIPGMQQNFLDTYKNGKVISLTSYTERHLFEL